MFTLDAARSEVRIGDVLHTLTPSERTVLLVLFTAHGEPVTMRDIARALDWPESMAATRQVRINVSKLVHRVRCKIGSDAILTHHGAYALAVSQAARCPTCGRVA